MAAWLADAQQGLWRRVEDLSATSVWLVRYDAPFHRQWLAPGHDAPLERPDCLPRALIGSIRRLLA